MSANAPETRPERPAPDTPNPHHATVILLSNHAARARNIEIALGASHCAGMAVVRHSLRGALALSGDGEPSLIVIDAQDPDMDALHELKRVRAVLPAAPLILLHGTPDAVVASRALRAGATAFLASHEISTLLVAAIDKAVAGERFVSEEVMQGILHGMTETIESESRVPIEILSDREMMVFQLLGKGKCPRNIADELGVNIKTVATHCNNIRRKLHTSDNRQLTRISHDWAEGRLGQPTTGGHYHR